MLVDSCVWIDFFNGRQNPQVDELRRALRHGVPIIGDLVRLEVLRGYRDPRTADKVGALLAVCRMVELLGAARIDAAVRLDHALQGIGRPMSTIDLVIASWCVTEGVALLTRDQAFARVAAVAPLRLAVAIDS